MKKKSKIIIARLIAVLMVFSILPFDMLTTANVVMAEELDNGVDVNAALDDEGNAGGIDIGNPELIGGIPGGDVSSPEGENDGKEDEPEAPTGTDDSLNDTDDKTNADGATDANDKTDADDTQNDADDKTDADAPTDAATPNEAVESKSTTYRFCPDELGLTGDYTTGTIVTDGAKYNNYFTMVNTGTTPTAKIKQTSEDLSTGKKGSDNNTYKYRYQFGGTSTKDKAMIKFTTTEETSTVSICAYLSTKNVERHIYFDDVQKDLLTTAVSLNSYQVSAGEHYFYAGDGEYCILYINVVEGSSSSGGGGTTPTPTDVDVTIGNTDIITSAVVSTGTKFVEKDTGTDATPTAITLTAEAKTAETVENSAAIKTAVDNLIKDLSPEVKNEVKTLYYDLTIADAAEGNTALDIKEGTGTIKITMPYTIAAGTTNKNKITVLHDTKELKATKGTDGFSFDADGFSPYTVIVQPQSDEKLAITNADGYEEGVYAEWEPVEGAAGYRAYVSPAGSDNFVRVDNELIRKYADYWRVDALGLAAGSYRIKIEAGTVKKINGTEDLDEILAEVITDPLTVTNYDRSGFAFSENSNFGTGSGAYNDNGTLKAGAQVVYVTKDTAKSCTAWVHTGGADKAAVEVTGFQSILDAKQKGGTEIDIIDFRIIGCLSKADLDHISSSSEGIQVKAQKQYGGMNITIEGVGEDAVVKGFGFLVRNCGNVEMRNFALMDFMDDGVSLDTGNCNVWLHNLDIFYGGPGGDSDQAKGDGSIDIKAASTYVTVSYNHFWDSGKCSLCGMTGDKAEFMVTYHHNWFDHSDSRHARVRRGTVHAYNNYYDGNAKYGIGAANSSNIFLESNYFRNANSPMIIASQASDLGSDGHSTMSGEDGGMIKAWDNIITKANHLIYQNSNAGTSPANATSFDAYLASARDEKVPNTVKALKGGSTYNNFDTDTTRDLGVTLSDIDPVDTVPNKVMSKAGRLNGGDFTYTFSEAEDKNYSVISDLKNKILSYTTSVKSIGGIAGVSSSGGPAPVVTVVAAPTANPSSGAVELNAKIKLTTSTAEAKIYYTTDGTKPTESSTLYSGEITITADTVIKAIAIKDGTSSSVATFTYTLPDTGTVRKPTASPASGTVTKGTKVVITNNTTGATVYYTEDGNDPKANGASSFTGTSKEFTIDADTTIKAAAKLDDEWSDVVTFAYTVSTTPVVTGGYIHNFTVSGKTSSYYTINGNMQQDKNVTPFDYNGLNLTKALKMESATSIKFNAATKGTLVLVVNAATKVDGDSKTPSNNVISVELATGEHTISKDSTANLYYIEFKPEGGIVEPGGVLAPEADIETDSMVEKGTEVYLFCDTDGADIYFTTDGTTPTKNSTLYKERDGANSTGPIIVNEDMTIKAIAIKGEDESSVSTFTYTVADDGEEVLYAEAPVADPAAGKVNEGTVVKLSSPTSDETDGVEIYYTTDGSNPKTAGNDNVFRYREGSIVINRKTTIRAYTKAPGYISSNDVTFVYTVAGATATTVKKEFNAQQAAAAEGKTANFENSANKKYGTDDYFTLVNKSGSTSKFQHTDSKNNPVIATAPNPSSSVSGITDYSWRYTFGGKSGNDSRYIEFTNKAVATVKICAYVATSNLSANRTIILDNTSKTHVDTPTEHVFENIAPGTHKIKAGVGDCYVLYIVVEETSSEDDNDVTDPPYDAEITATPAPSSENIAANTPITLTWKDSSDKLYYTLDETDPRFEGTGTTRVEYKGTPITFNKTTTIKAVAQKADGAYSQVKAFKYTIESGGSTLTKDSWTVFFKQNLDTYEYEYTGSAIKPEFTVYGVNGKVLVEGSDYTVRYSNNINASLKWNATKKEYEDINTNVNRQPTITIIGRGIITGQYKVNFKIKPKDISNAKGGVDITGPEDSKLVAAKIIIEKGKKATTPVICYNGIKLTARDYDYVTPKTTVYNDNGVLTIKGKGNYENELKITVTAVDRGKLKDTVKKLKVNTRSDEVKKLIYNGAEQAEKIRNCIEVKPVTSGTISEGTDYVVVLPSNIKDAGNVKVMVVGLGDYSGCTVTKSVRIQPCAITGKGDTTVWDKVKVTAGTSSTYTSTGATLDDLKVEWKGKSEPLVNGKDYKLTYSGNRAVPTNGKKAQCNISFMGNFKGRITGAAEFTVEPEELKDGDGTIVEIPDKVCNANAICKSVPYVTVNGVLVKASEYTVTYSVGDKNGTYTDKPKAAFVDGVNTVYVHITAKGKNYKKDTVATGQYTIWQKNNSKKDLSRARVTIYDKETGTDRKRVTRMEYTGAPIEFNPKCIEVKIGQETLTYGNDYTIDYVNNVNKGRATIIIKAVKESTKGCIGSKTQAFTIVSRNIKTGGANELKKDTDPLKVKSIFNIFNW